VKFLANTILSLAITCAAVSATSGAGEGAWLPETLTLGSLGRIISTDLTGLIRIVREAPINKLDSENPKVKKFLQEYNYARGFGESYTIATTDDEKEKILNAFKNSIVNLWYVNRQAYFETELDFNPEVFGYIEKLISLAQGVFKDLGLPIDEFKPINAWLYLEDALLRDGKKLPRELFKGLPKSLGQLLYYNDIMWAEVKYKGDDFTKKDLETAVRILADF
jgi:hypothetical protein